MDSQTVAIEPDEDFIARLLRQLETHGGGSRPPALIFMTPPREKRAETAPDHRRSPRHEMTPPCATGLYRQEKLLMRADSVERLETIKKRFLKRKADWQAPMAMADFVNASVAFVLRHVDFDDLDSVEALDVHIASRLQPRGPRA